MRWARRATLVVIGPLTYLRRSYLYPKMDIGIVGLVPHAPRPSMRAGAPTPAYATSVPSDPRLSRAARAASAAWPRASIRGRSGAGLPRWTGPGRVPSPSQGSAVIAWDRRDGLSDVPPS